MKEAVGEMFPDDKYQRCTVHFYRNVFSVVPKSKVKIVAKVLKTIHTYESKKATCVSVPSRFMRKIVCRLRLSE